MHSAATAGLPADADAGCGVRPPPNNKGRQELMPHSQHMLHIACASLSWAASRQVGMLPVQAAAAGSCLLCRTYPERPHLIHCKAAQALNGNIECFVIFQPPLVHAKHVVHLCAHESNSLKLGWHQLGSLKSRFSALVVWKCWSAGGAASAATQAIPWRHVRRAQHAQHA